MQGVGTHTATPVPGTLSQKLCVASLGAGMLIIHRDFPPSQGVLCVISITE